MAKPTPPVRAGGTYKQWVGPEPNFKILIYLMNSHQMHDILLTTDYTWLRCFGIAHWCLFTMLDSWCGIFNVWLCFIRAVQWYLAIYTSVYRTYNAMWFLIFGSLYFFIFVTPSHQKNPMWYASRTSNTDLCLLESKFHCDQWDLSLCKCVQVMQFHFTEAGHSSPI